MNGAVDHNEAEGAAGGVPVTRQEVVYAVLQDIVGLGSYRVIMLPARPSFVIIPPSIRSFADHGSFH